MKKILFFFILSSFLVGCSKKTIITLEIPIGEVELRKDQVIVWDVDEKLFSEKDCNVNTYRPIILTTETEINELFSKLNQFKYAETLEKVPLCGYSYFIKWEDKQIGIFKKNKSYYVYINQEIYKIIGDTKFFENYNFEVEN